MVSTRPPLHKYNDLYTPPAAMNYICPYLDNSLIYWEACWGKGHMANELKRRGFKVKGHPDWDCFGTPPAKWDFFITNPPFSNNKHFVERAILLKKPFALLLRLEHIGGVDAMRLLGNLDWQLIIPERRINFITPKMMRGEKVGGAQYHSIWLTYGVDLPRQINYVKTRK